MFPEELEKFKDCVSPTLENVKAGKQICPMLCDFKKCDLKCSATKLNDKYWDNKNNTYKKLTKDELNYNTFNNDLAKYEINLIKNRIKDLFRFKHVYIYDEILGEIKKSFINHQAELFEDQFLDQALDIKVGRFGEGEDFNSFNCDFQYLALCGSQVGNWVCDQWYNWPVSQWALRVKYNLHPDLYPQIGAYEYNPENLERGKGFNLSTDGSHGAIIPAEVVWSPKLGVQSMPGEYRLGYYYSTADAKEIADSTKTSHKQGVWVTAKQKLFQPADQTDRGLTGFVNLTFHDSDTNKVDNMQNIGLVYKGLLNQRPQDELALGVARIHINDDWNDVQAKEYDTEYNTELYYGIHATNWLTIRPNVQYVRHVGALKNGDNTWVGGIKFSTAF
jgi:carbohydrate-selective porin OprB